MSENSWKTVERLSDLVAVWSCQTRSGAQLHLFKTEQESASVKSRAEPGRAKPSLDHESVRASISLCFHEGFRPPGSGSLSASCLLTSSSPIQGRELTC